MLTNIEIGCFVNLFNRSGYVLNFTTADFDAFTFQHRQSSCVHQDQVFQHVHARSNRPVDGDKN